MNPFDMLKNINSLKDQLGTMQSELQEITATGFAGGNIVNVTINGKFEITNVKLDPICVDPRDVQMLQDLIIAAHHDAMSKIQDELKTKYGSMLGGMGIPNL